ncbi:hypothetical protein [Robertmurraya massiliosenegalensis]|uniref:hypothetical protein n=1 Tax=Robertmurraya massiliosenegalensis TaxID=1287657 RepID=UPI0002E3E4D0|nr:hypothetical protein [Robertmurraya massiliosenegalensis]
MTQELTYLFLHEEGLEKSELVIFGIPNDDFNMSLQASINDLRYDMYKQKRLLSLGVHPDEMLCPWNGSLVVVEGICSWNELKKDYELIK